MDLVVEDKSILELVIIIGERSSTKKQISISIIHKNGETEEDVTHRLN